MRWWAAGRPSRDPDPTYYGDEICYVNGMRYAAEVLADVAVYRLATMGFTPGDLAQVGPEYGLKESEGSLRLARSSSCLDDAQPARILDVGCSGGQLAAQLRDRGHHVTGVDRLRDPRTSRIGWTCSSRPTSSRVSRRDRRGFDWPSPRTSSNTCATRTMPLREMGGALDAGGPVLISLPNFGHWYPRSRTLLGVFDYDQRGILDKTARPILHPPQPLRMIRRRLRGARIETTGLPIEVLARRQLRPSGRSLGVDSLLVRLRPTLFAYQFVVEVEPVKPPRSVVWARSIS